MSLTGGFFNSKNGDITYNARQVGQLFDGLISDGIFNTIGDAFQVTPAASTGYTVLVGTGKAWYDHIWIYNDDTYSITLTTPAVGRNRYDLLCLYVNDSERTVSINVISGEETTGTAQIPSVPDERHHPFARINVRNDRPVQQVSTGDITYGLANSVTGLVQQLSLPTIQAKFEALYNAQEDDRNARYASSEATRQEDFDDQHDTIDQWWEDIKTYISETGYGALVGDVQKILDAFNRDDDGNVLRLKLEKTNYVITGQKAETVLGLNATAEGSDTTATGDYSHAEGKETTAGGGYAHAEGYQTETTELAAHAEGWGTHATAEKAHAEGQYTYATDICAHTEGQLTQASSVGAHAEGYKTEAFGSYSHAEGYQSKSGGYAHAEGYNTSANSTASHAEGSNTTTSDNSAHAEGISTIARAMGAHAEGNKTIASGNYSHSEGTGTTAAEQGAHSEGQDTTASGYDAHAEGSETTASGYHSHAEGQLTQATGISSHAEGESTTAIGYRSHAEGCETKASGPESHAEGYKTEAIGQSAHAEGYKTIAGGNYGHAEGYGSSISENVAYSHAEGLNTMVTAYYAHAEGTNTSASGTGSHAEGHSTDAQGMDSHTEGTSTATSINSYNSHAEGSNTYANGDCSHAAGCYTEARNYQTVVGRYNTIRGAAASNTGDTVYNANSGYFIVGCGTNISSYRANCFRATESNTYGKTYATSGADYAEMFEWTDGNKNKEDRAGLFVTLDGDKLRLATPSDDYILGIVSANASVIGDVYDDEWQGMFIKDIFGRPKKHVYHTDPVYDTFIDKDGKDKKIIVQPASTIDGFEVNPDYDPDEPYIPRTERPEWDAVGLVGKLVCIDDGTAQVNDYVKCNDQSMATKSDVRTKYRVMKRLDETHIQIMIL